MNWLLPVLEALILVSALSVDALVTGFAYGTNRIRIPWLSTAIISGVCTAMLALTLFCGKLIGPYIPDSVAIAISFLILFLMGLVKVFDSAVKALIRRHKGFRRNIRFSAFHVGFILSVYADPEEADKDNSKRLSPAEAASLALALSLDGLAVGFGAGVTNTNPILLIALSLLMNAACIIGGSWAGNRIARKTSVDLTWLSGIFLIILAILKLPH